MSTDAALAQAQPTMRSVPDTASSNASLYASADYFGAEMAALAASSWQFFCTTHDLANANDWVRRRVFGVDVFVQNFVGTLRGYHNVCQHRGFPLRREARGNGTVQCLFHGWAYSPDGIPLGIPRNKELFGLTRAQQGELAIPEIRVATVGRFVFVALEASAPPIELFLGRYGALLRSISKPLRSIYHRWTGSVRANWKLYYEVTLDDYHVTFVHPTTLGTQTAPVAHSFYDREGPHSHLFGRRDADWPFSGFWHDASQGEYDFTGYKIQHVFPNLILASVHRSVLVTLLTPLAPDLTEVEDIIFDLAGAPAENGTAQDTWSDGHRAIADEDRQVVESQQETIGQFAGRPLFGELEKRVGWFHESYEELVGADARRRLGR